MGSPLQHFVERGRKILGAAINYKAVIEKMNIPQPKNPIIFLKPTTSYIKVGQNIKAPENCTLNQEIELGVIIGEKCKDVKECDAMKFVGGYCLALDMGAVSELDEIRKKGLPWTIFKGFDTACPVSRFITPEEIKDPHNIEIWCKINGKMKQSTNTSDLIFNIPQLISYLATYMTLEPYDLILTGTPLGNDPIAKGDVIEGGIKDLITFKFPVE